MPGKYSEHAFETAIEHHLVTTGGYEKGDSDKFDPARGLFPQEVLSFIENTQPKEWEYLKGLQKERAGETLLEDEVTLKYYRLEKISEGSIDLGAGESGEVSGPVSVGTGVVSGEEIELSRLVDLLNERFGTEFKPADQLFFDSIREDAVADADLRQAARANTLENFGYVFLKALEGLFIDRMEQNEEITARFMNEKEFQDVVGRFLTKQVYEQIREEEKVVEST